MAHTKPFIILALPRTGTKMVAEAIGSVHEFTGTESEFWKRPSVLSNVLEDWMLSPEITRFCLWREDAIAGAVSLLLMSYRFPDNSFVLPKHEVNRVAQFRQKQEERFRAVSDWSFSYESLCGGKEISRLPDWFTQKIRDMVGVDPGMIHSRKTSKPVPLNESELWQSA